jgi:tetratricopeptide (TPR) repeat protein
MDMPVKPGAEIAVAPLIGSRQTEDSRWLGAMFSKLLAEHLSAAGLPVLDYNAFASQLAQDKIQLPLNEVSIEGLRRSLGLKALVHGRYVVDDESKMIGLRLLIEKLDAPRIPMEVSAPLAGFPAFVERVSLALAEQLGLVIDESVRRKVNGVPRPAQFEAFRQFSMATMSWSKGQNQLALTSVASALALDPDLEEAAAIQTAIARDADDPATTRDAFRRWATIATKRRRPDLAAERLLMLGHWLMERGEWSEARRAYEDARDVFQTANDEIGKARVANNLANLDLLTGKVQNAIQTFRRSLRTFETSPAAQPDVAITYYNLGVAHKSLGQSEEAGSALEQALTLARSLKDARLEAYSLAQRGALHDDQGDWGKAASDYAQSTRLLDAAGDPRATATVRSHQAILKKQQGKYGEAERLMLDALEAFDSGGDPHERAVLWFNLADLYLAMGAYDGSWEYAEKALEAFTRLKSGWGSRARQLIETLQRIPKPEPPPDEAEQDPPTTSAPSALDELDALRRPAAPDDPDLPGVSSDRGTDLFGPDRFDPTKDT